MNVGPAGRDSEERDVYRFAPVFFVLFGVMFLVVGVQRLSRVATEQNKREAVLWGTIGVVLAAVFFGIAVWFFTGDPKEDRRRQIEIWDRSGIHP